MKSAPRWSVFTILLVLLSRGLAAEERASAYKTTTTPAPSGRGSIVKIETAGPVSNRYQAFDVGDDTTFDFTGAHLASGPDHPQRQPITIGEQERPPKNIRIVGGVIDGGIPREWKWTLSHAFGGSGVYTVASGLQAIEGMRIHNVEDGWHPRETPGFKLRAYPNTSRFLVRNCYMTAVRDDCIENDEFIPGDVEDSLFDGVWAFISEQNERQAGVFRPKVATIGPDEDPNINLTRALVRLTRTNAGEPGAGKWFKLIGRESPVHHFNITDCVFATDTGPRQGGWRTLGFPKGATFRGNNFVLWLGKPGEFGGEIPEGVKFLEGEPARAKWNDVRNQWLRAHGYDPRQPDDLDPMQAPVRAPRRPASN